MAKLTFMPKIEIKQEELQPFGEAWNQNEGRLSRTPPYSSIDLGTLFDKKVGQALAYMLGSNPIISAISTSLVPKETNRKIFRANRKII